VDRYPNLRVWVAVAIVPVSVAMGWLSRSHGHWFDWGVAVGTATAYGTVALAFVTWRLVSSTREDAAGTLRLAKLAEQDQEVRIRPCVYPYSLRHLELVMGDLVVLPLQNGGQGLALNVSGHIYWPAGDAALASTTLYPGDIVQLPVRGSVPIEIGSDIWGRLEYRDLRGRSWETRFIIEFGPDQNLRPSVRAYGRAEALPSGSYPAGWDLVGGVPSLALVWQDD
jgi:hypothetical protein